MMNKPNSLLECVDDVDSASRVVTAVRVRPLSNTELEQNNQIVVAIERNVGEVTLINPVYYECKSPNATPRDRTLDERHFNFDYSFWSVSKQDVNYADQKLVYEKLGLPIVQNCIDGYNSSFFAYGQTGSGKTFTMIGKADSGEEGIIPRLSKDILETFQSMDATKTFEHMVQKVDFTVSFFEIYNEKIYDLLATTPGSVCRVREHPEQGVYVENLTRCAITNYSHVANALAEGHSKRQVAPTLMNAESSRSHAIFIIFVVQELLLTADGATTTTRCSRVCLVDLAGSERVQSTGAKGNRLKEATNINKSLSVLGDVINALSETTTGREKFIPYRNSVLTYVLKDSLGGNSKTTMLATISPTEAAYNESMNTLRYIERAKLIMTHVVVNSSGKDENYIKQLQHQINSYKLQLQSQNLEFQKKMQQLQSRCDSKQDGGTIRLDNCRMCREYQALLQNKDETLRILDMELEQVKSDNNCKSEVIKMLCEELELRSVENIDRLSKHSSDNAGPYLLSVKSNAESSFSTTLSNNHNEFYDMLRCENKRLKMSLMVKAEEYDKLLKQVVKVDKHCNNNNDALQQPQQQYDAVLRNKIYSLENELALVRSIRGNVAEQTIPSDFSQQQQQQNPERSTLQSQQSSYQQSEELPYNNAQTSSYATVERLNKLIQEKEFEVDNIIRVAEEREVENSLLRHELEYISASFYNLQQDYLAQQKSVKADALRLVQQLQSLQHELTSINAEMRAEKDLHQEEKRTLLEDLTQQMTEIKVLRESEAELKALMSQQESRIAYLLTQLEAKELMYIDLQKKMSELTQKKEVSCDNAVITRLTSEVVHSISTSDEDLRDQLSLALADRARLEAELTSLKIFDHDTEGIAQALIAAKLNLAEMHHELDIASLYNRKLERKIVSLTEQLSMLC